MFRNMHELSENAWFSSLLQIYEEFLNQIFPIIIVQPGRVEMLDVKASIQSGPFYGAA